MNLTAVHLKVSDGYVAYVEELPGTHTQGETLDEARENLREAVELLVQANRELCADAISDAQPQEVTKEAFALEPA